LHLKNVYINLGLINMHSIKLLFCISTNYNTVPMHVPRHPIRCPALHRMIVTNNNQLEGIIWTRFIT